MLTLPASDWFIALASAYPGAVTVAQPHDWRVAVRDVRVRCGTPTNCAGVAGALVDFEPAREFRFEARLATGITDEDSDSVQLWVAAFEKGVRSELINVGGGTLPPVRLILRWILDHPIDSNEAFNVLAGRMGVAEAIRRASAAEGPPTKSRGEF